MTTDSAACAAGSGGRTPRLGLAVFLTTLVLDQAHKWWMLEVYGIADRGRVDVTPFLDLVFVKNIGISYSHVRSGELRGARSCWRLSGWRRPSPYGCGSPAGPPAGFWPSPSG